MSDYSHYVDKTVGYKTDDPVFQIHELNVDLKANHIYLLGESQYAEYEADGAEPGVEYVMANRFIKNLNILIRKSSKPILVHMKTNGGDWGEGMAIYDTIKACPNPITILSYTHARSMSSLIFLAADKSVMMPNSTFMFHAGTNAMDGTHKQFQTEAIEAQKTYDVMLDIYIDAMKKKGKLKNRSRKFIKAWLEDLMNKKEEVYLDANQAVKYGFADEVFGANGVYDWESLITYDEE